MATSQRKMLTHLLLSLVIVTGYLSVSYTQEDDCPEVCESCIDGVANCSFASLTAAPRDYPNDTSILNLEGNQIRVIGTRTFSDLPTLEILKITKNKVTALRNDAFKKFANLVTLDLQGNRIKGIQRGSFRGLFKLKTLALNRNRIRSSARIFWHVPNLYQLNVAKNRIRQIGEHDLKALTKVHYIDFRDNIITTVHSKAFKTLTTLRYLFLKDNPIVKMPMMEFGSQNLQLVDISRCKLVKVPQPLPASVGDLRLGNNQLAQINHTDFTNITDLQVLALNDNKLQFLADGSLRHLSSLQELWLRNNRLVYIPRDLPDNLRRLYMDKNSIQEIEAGLFTNESRLDLVTVENNQVARIAPGTFVGLRFLNVLNFQSNKLQHLEPRTFSNLGSLSTILLSGNPLQRIEAEAFHQLYNLSILHLSHVTTENFELDASFLPEMLRLKHLALMNSPGLAQALMDTIDNETSREVLNNLTHLDLSYNTLKQISPNIRTKFPNLKTLALDGNPLRCNGSLKWLADWMKSSNNVYFFNNEEPVCHAPWALRGLSVRDVRDDEWATPDNGDGEAYRDFQDSDPGQGGSQGEGGMQVSVSESDQMQGDAPSTELDDPIKNAEVKSVAEGKQPIGKDGSIKKGDKSVTENKNKNRKGKGRKGKGRKGKGRKGKESKDRKKGGKKDRQRNKDRKQKNKKGKRNRRKAEVFVNDEGTPLSAEMIN